MEPDTNTPTATEPVPRGFLLRLLSTGGPRVKAVGYLLVVVASVLWLSWDLSRRGIRSDWNAAFWALLSAVVVGYVGGKYVGGGDANA